jgi:hypothetical protein
MKKVNRIICAKWGHLYTDDDVNTLHKKIKANCSIPFEFECFTDFSEEFEHYKQKHYRASLEPDYRFDAVQNGYHRDDFGGIPHYRKILLFEMDKKFNKSDTILYLDLDTHIERDLAYFFEELDDEKPYIVWNYWWESKPEEWVRQYHITRCPLYNSSVMKWKPGQQRPIYNFLKENKDKCFYTYPSMDTFMFHQFGPYSNKGRNKHYSYFPEGLITSERVLTNNDLWTEYNEKDTSQKRGIIHMFEGMTKEEKKNNVSN